MKVFVLLKDTYNEVDEIRTEVYLFKTLEKAQQKMNEIFNIWVEPLRDDWRTELTNVFDIKLESTYALITNENYCAQGDLVDNLYLRIEEKEIED